MVAPLWCKCLVSVLVSVWTVFRRISVHSDAESLNTRFASIRAAIATFWHIGARWRKACPRGLIIPKSGVRFASRYHVSNQSTALSELLPRGDDGAHGNLTVLHELDRIESPRLLTYGCLTSRGRACCRHMTSGAARPSTVRD